MDPEAKPVSSPSTAASGLAALARRWVERRDQGLTPGEQRELQVWLSAGREHAAAFARADTFRTEFDWPLHAGVVDELLTGLATRAASRQRRRRGVISMAAAVVMVFGLSILWRSPVETVTRPGTSTSVVVVTPEKRVLPDGSIVELKGGAEIVVDFEGLPRVVTLTRGTAHFQVVKDASRAFLVKAGAVTARAVGTAFVVEFESQAVSVVVTEGQVAVDQTPIGHVFPDAPAPEPVALLKAGHLVHVANEPTITASPVRTLPVAELEERLNWRIPHLEFNGTYLHKVVEMVNRHNRQQLVIADPALQKLMLSGILRADKIDALVKLLESDFDVKVERGEKDRLFLTSRTK